MRALLGLTLILSVYSTSATAKSLACSYHPSIRFNTILKQLGKSASRADRAAASALVDTKNMCESTKSEDLIKYYEKNHRDCYAACDRGSKSSKEAPILVERNAITCRLRCDQAIQASAGEAQAYQAGRSQGSADCSTGGAKSGASSQSATSSQ